MWVYFDLDDYHNAWRCYWTYVKKKYFNPFISDESSTRLNASLLPYIDLMTFKKYVKDIWTSNKFKVYIYFLFIYSCLGLYCNTMC